MAIKRNTFYYRLTYYSDIYRWKQSCPATKIIKRFFQLLNLFRWSCCHNWRKNLKQQATQHGKAREECFIQHMRNNHSSVVTLYENVNRMIRYWTYFEICAALFNVYFFKAGKLFCSKTSFILSNNA